MVPYAHSYAGGVFLSIECTTQNIVTSLAKFPSHGVVLIAKFMTLDKRMKQCKSVYNVNK